MHFYGNNLYTVNQMPPMLIIHANTTRGETLVAGQVIRNVFRPFHIEDWKTVFIFRNVRQSTQYLANSHAKLQLWHSLTIQSRQR